MKNGLLSFFPSTPSPPPRLRALSSRAVKAGVENGVREHRVGVELEHPVDAPLGVGERRGHCERLGDEVRRGVDLGDAVEIKGPVLEAPPAVLREGRSPSLELGEVDAKRLEVGGSGLPNCREESVGVERTGKAAVHAALHVGLQVAGGDLLGVDEDREGLDL